MRRRRPPRRPAQRRRGPGTSDALAGMLAAAGVDPAKPLTEHDLEQRFLAPGQAREYLDYAEAVGPGNTREWRRDGCRVSDAAALDRIGTLLAAAGDQPGVEHSIAAIVRATGRTDVRAAGAAEIERAVDAMLACDRYGPI